METALLAFKYQTTPADSAARSSVLWQNEACTRLLLQLTMLPAPSSAPFRQQHRAFVALSGGQEYCHEDLSTESTFIVHGPRFAVIAGVESCWGLWQLQPVFTVSTRLWYMGSKIGSQIQHWLSDRVTFSRRG